MNLPPPVLVATGASRRPRVSLWLLRVLLSAQVVTAVLQPLLAGMFLGGDVDAIVWHRVVGGLMTLLGIVVAVVSLCYVLAGDGRRWLLPVAAAAAILDVVQLGLGFGGSVRAHVPLGVAAVAVAAGLACWAWTPAAGRAR